MKYKLIIFIGLLIGFMSYEANAKMPCASKDEMKAFDLRALQNHLMIAALSCGEQNNYNKFIKDNNVELILHGEYLKGYFMSNYNNSAEAEMNKFITALANEVSVRSLEKNQGNFCGEAKQIFKQTRSLKMNKVAEFASKKEFTSLHKIKQCN